MPNATHDSDNPAAQANSAGKSDESIKDLCDTLDRKLKRNTNYLIAILTLTSFILGFEVAQMLNRLGF